MLTLIAGSLLLAAALLAGDDGPPRQDAGSPDARAEYFVLEGPPPADGARAPREALALVAWRRLELADGELVEREVVFRDGRVRVLQSERSAREDGRVWSRMVWRELRGERAPGRTWIADRLPDPRGFRTLSFGTRGPVHGWIPFAESVEPLLPLELVELWRRGAAAGQGELQRLDPLVKAAEPVLCSLSPGDVYGLTAGAVEAGAPRAAEEPLRTVEARRVDGSLVLRCVLRGDELLAFQWHAGGARARRLGEDAYRRTLDAWQPPDPPFGTER